MIFEIGEGGFCMQTVFLLGIMSASSTTRSSPGASSAIDEDVYMSGCVSFDYSIIVDEFIAEFNGWCECHDLFYCTRHF
jgi:hypothetical protein